MGLSYPSIASLNSLTCYQLRPKELIGSLKIIAGRCIYLTSKDGKVRVWDVLHRLVREGKFIRFIHCLIEERQSEACGSTC